MRQEVIKIDALFSQYIRKRALNRVNGCERCLQGKTSTKKLHCAHMFPRRKYSVRWDIDNACGLCPGCHRFLDDNALDKVRFFVALLGQETFDLLEARSTQGQHDIGAITLYLQSKLKEIENEGG